MSQSELTDAICKMQQIYSAKSIEGMSSILNNHYSIVTDVINELIRTDKNLLKEKIRKLLNGCMPSKISHTHCWKSGDCSYGNQSSCTFCKYSIPTTYTLLTINKQLLTLMEELMSVNKDEMNERRYYTHKISALMHILQEAKKDFIGYDSENEEFFKTFLDINIISEKYKILKQQNLLLT